MAGIPINYVSSHNLSRIWGRKKKDLLRVSRFMYELDATRYTDHVPRAELYLRGLGV